MSNDSDNKDQNRIQKDSCNIGNIRTLGNIKNLKNTLTITLQWINKDEDISLIES